MIFKEKVLVTGGCGYIGSHTCLYLIENGYEPIIVDNLCNSNTEVLNRIKSIIGYKPIFYELDVRDENALDEVFCAHDIKSVIHFAGLKAVGESVEKPDLYYDNNIGSTNTLLKIMNKHNVKNIIFSSSATVYGNPKRVPIYENDPIGEVTNPYAETKVKIEYLLQDLANHDKTMNIGILRYFNPIGAHKSGLMGENPKGIPNNLMPYVTQVAIGLRDHLNVFGNDYDTRDGTCIRDYIHVCDLARGHVLTLNKLHQNSGLVIYNLGTSIGTTVLELVNAFEKANKIIIKKEFAPRRAGDIAECYANCDKAYKEIGFKTEFNIVDCCRDSWNWQKKNPNGFN